MSLPRLALFTCLGHLLSSSRIFRKPATVPPACIVVFFIVAILSGAGSALGQDIRIQAEVRESGVIRSIQPGKISLTTGDGKTMDCKIQDKDENAISLGGTAVRLPAKISVTGSLPVALIEKGMIVRFDGRTNQYGKCEGTLATLDLLADATAELKVDFLEPPEPGDTAGCEVVGRVIKLTKNELQLQVPKAKWAKRERIAFDVSEKSVLKVVDDDLNLVQAGDVVSSVVIYELSSGEKVIKEINIQLNSNRQQMTTSFNDQLEQRFSALSDNPAESRQLNSDNFILYTDLSDRSAAILLAKLESMHSLIGGYFGKRPRIPIECYVVADMNKWRDKNLHPSAIAKILEPAGVTMSTSQPGTRTTKAVVYSCDRHGVCQHEAVHAFCAQTFGSTGPVWYSEGMAEMGQYWKPGEKSVSIDPVVIDYLTHAPPKKMADIVGAGQITGDSWQAYAWRWALCHLLANNPNYNRRFKKLGLDMMSGGKDSFENAFGGVAANISFEYDQFVQNFGNGYRVDLCSWDWTVVPKNLSGTGRIKTEVLAAAGWQPTKLLARVGTSYDFVTEGQWKTGAIGNSLSGAGDADGQGKLVGILLHDFQVDGPFDLGAKGSFVAPVDGQLFLRCADRWTELSDNEGQMMVHLRRTPRDEADDTEIEVEASDED